MKVSNIKKTLFNNPVVYKDLIQNLRSKIFTISFFGSITLVELIYIPFLLSEGRGNSKAGEHFILFLGICFYAFIAITTQRRASITQQEIQSKTFDMFLMGGMTPEKIVKGKLSGLYCTFFFLLSCLLPFMAAGYFLGGIDFLSIFALVIHLLVVSLPFFLTTIIFSFLPSKKTATLLIHGSSIFLGIFGFALMAFGAHGMLREMKHSLLALFYNTRTNTLYFSLESLGMALFFIALYYLICRALFYIATHMLCFKIDSREEKIKSSYFFLVILFLIFASFTHPSTRGLQEMLIMYFYTILPLFLLFYSEENDLPTMVQLRKETSTWNRLHITLFGPGINAHLRFFFLTTIFVFIIILSLLTNKNTAFDYLMPLLQVPYFVILPLKLLKRFTSIKKRRYAKTIVLFFWGFCAIAIEIMFEFRFMIPRSFVRNFMAPLLSPIHSFASISRADYSPTISFFTGLIGVTLLIILCLKSRRKKPSIQ